MDLIFDTHAHYDDEAFNEDREELLSGLFGNGVGTIVDISANFEGIPDVLALAEKYDFLYAAVGVHPSEVYDLADRDIDRVEQYAVSGKKVVAVGEIGLDYHYPDTDKEKQQKWFAMQIDLAKRIGLPIVVHSRDAAKDTLDMIRAEGAKETGGVIHCFSYEWEMAKLYLDMGFYIGIGGVVTFKKSRKLKEIAEKIPMEQLLLETDCPYLAPEPFRGRRNNSSLLRYVVETIAELRNMDPEDVIRITAENARRFYRIQEQK